jgi:hypothetical protein
LLASAVELQAEREIASAAVAAKATARDTSRFRAIVHPLLDECADSRR